MAGLDACLLDEQRPSLAVALQRVGLTTGAVEREHELGAGAFAQRLVASTLLELGDQLAVATQGERAVDALLGGDEAILVEPGGVDLRVALDLCACEGIAAPERQRLLVGVECSGVIARARHRASAHHECGEDARVEFSIAAHDAVAGDARLDARRVAEGVSQPRHVLVDHVLRTAWRRLAPDAVDQALDRHHLAGVEQQDGQQRALTPPERNGALVQLDFERPQDPEGGLHEPSEDRTHCRSRPLGAPWSSRGANVERLPRTLVESIGAPAAPPAIRGATCRTTMGATVRELVRRASARATITRARSSRRCGAARGSSGTRNRACWRDSRPPSDACVVPIPAADRSSPPRPRLPPGGLRSKRPENWRQRVALPCRSHSGAGARSA